MEKEFLITSHIILDKDIIFTELTTDFNNNYIVRTLTLYDYKNADLHLKMFNFENLELEEIDYYLKSN